MIRDRVAPVVLSIVVLILVAVVQDRSRSLAAIIAAMPLTAPLAMWIVFSASQGDQRQTADFVGSLAVGFAAGLVFILVCWLGFRQQWGFAPTVSAGFVVWLALVTVPRWVAGWLR